MLEVLNAISVAGTDILQRIVPTRARAIRIKILLAISVERKDT